MTTMSVRGGRPLEGTVAVRGLAPRRTHRTPSGPQGLTGIDGSRSVGAVRDHHGNKTLAARSLCISRAYLHRLLRLAEADPQFAQDLRESALA